MEVEVEVQRRTETLDQRDGPGLRPGRDGESSPLNKESRDGAVDHPQDLAQYLRFCSEQEPQRIGEGQHPLPDGLPGQHVVDQVRSTLDHAPGTAGRTAAAALAGKRDQSFMLTPIALEA